MSGISESNLIINSDISPKLNSWLQHNQPITDKLKSSTGAAQLEVHSQKWTTTTWWDTYFLYIMEKTIFQREITMKSRGQPFWYARSVIPQSCYEIDSNFFQRLQHESIRNLIFNEPKVHLIQRKIYPISAQCIEYHWIARCLSSVPEILWGRLAEFCFQSKGSFYLLEILFPQLEELD